MGKKLKKELIVHLLISTGSHVHTREILLARLLDVASFSYFWLFSKPNPSRT